MVTGSPRVCRAQRNFAGLLERFHRRHGGTSEVEELAGGLQCNANRPPSRLLASASPPSGEMLKQASGSARARMPSPCISSTDARMLNALAWASHGLVMDIITVSHIGT